MNTQLKAWREIQATLPAKRAAVYGAVATHDGITEFEVGIHLGWNINSISGRITELKDAQLITKVGTRINPASGKHVNVYKVVSDKLF